MAGIFDVKNQFATKLHLNADAQPLIKAFRSEAIIDRQIDELIGIIKGVMADGMIHQGEIEFLLAWMHSNRNTCDKWPSKVIYPRLAAALADGVIDIQEESEIMDILLATVGGNTAPQHGLASDSTSLPLSKPAPHVFFAEHSFCFTGKFASGTRQWCEEQVLSRGATISGITKKLRFLVIGEIGSNDWLHSTHGRKIEKAIELNSNDALIHIIAEEHWHKHLA